MSNISFYDQKAHLLQCSCGFIWKPLVRDYKDFDINDHKCPNGCQNKESKKESREARGEVELE